MSTSLTKHTNAKKHNYWPFVGFKKDFEDIFDNFYNLYNYNSTPSEGSEMILTPKINISENPKAFEILAELPGVQKENIKVNILNNVLTISAEKKSEKEEKDKNWHRVESYYGTFERQIQLSENIKDDAIVADFKDGLLRINIEKKTPTETQNSVKQISIK
jgi:HSP20 family protein